LLNGARPVYTPRRPWRFRSRLSRAVITCSYHAPLCYHVRGHVPPNLDLPPADAGRRPGPAVCNFLATFPHPPPARKPFKGVGAAGTSHAETLRALAWRRPYPRAEPLHAAATVAPLRIRVIIRYSRAHRVRSSTRPVVA